MHTNKEPLIGFCPIGKFVFSHEDAMRLKGLVRAKLDEWKVRYVDLEGVLPDGMVRDQKHVEPVVRFFQQQGIDALFLPALQFWHGGGRGDDRQAVRRAHAVVGAARRGAAARRHPPARLALRHAGHQRSALHLAGPLQLHQQLPRGRRGVPQRRRPFRPRRPGGQDDSGR